MKGLLFAHVPTGWVLAISALIVAAGLVAGVPVLAGLVGSVWLVLRLSYNRWLVVGVADTPEGVVVHFSGGRCVTIDGTVHEVTRGAWVRRCLFGGGPLLVQHGIGASGHSTVGVLFPR